jgi:hypothetical protein
MQTKIGAVLAAFGAWLWSGITAIGKGILALYLDLTSPWREAGEGGKPGPWSSRRLALAALVVAAIAFAAAWLGIIAGGSLVEVLKAQPIVALIGFLPAGIFALGAWGMAAGVTKSDVAEVARAIEGLAERKGA